MPRYAMLCHVMPLLGYISLPYCNVLYYSLLYRTVEFDRNISCSLYAADALLDIHHLVTINAAAQCCNLIGLT